MAASEFGIKFSNGQVLSVYQASGQAVNTNPVCTFLGVASASTTTVDFTPTSDCALSDIIVSSALTAGGIEFYNVTRGRRSERGDNHLETYLITNTTRRPPAIVLKGGQTYRLIQTVAGNA
jgi:hypothetical protein